MATTHLPGTGLGSAVGARRRRLAVIAGVVLVGAAITVPFALRGLDHDRPATSATRQQVTPPASSRPHQHHATTDAALGTQADLPPLLSDGAPALREGAAVRVGDVTEGSLRHTTGAGWQVMVRWAGHLQPLTARGPVPLGAGSWVARSGLLYTRVATSTPGRYDVYSWQPQGGSAYSAPTLVASPLGAVCFNASFTAFGDCR
ncbi:MAG TPA: hypothetical protein VHW64_03595 [Nocardioides sp.]|jgi:hypothetical protein|uniref:hypothetical protein n=1 Tax=Nocardioides sp. TaxID=35761 RepID=UPI002E36BFAB|nr:hypothetical protein [Nocardioides sp.]HEX3929762.1 hypothetical protein [Nocardioides sp.]